MQFGFFLNYKPDRISDQGNAISRKREIACITRCHAASRGVMQRHEVSRSVTRCHAASRGVMQGHTCHTALHKV